MQERKGENVIDLANFFEISAQIRLECEMDGDTEDLGNGPNYYVGGIGKLLQLTEI